MLVGKVAKQLYNKEKKGSAKKRSEKGDGSALDPFRYYLIDD